MATDQETRSLILAKQSLIQASMGLQRRVVTYFLRNLCVELITITPSLMLRAYRWLIITWLGSGSSVGSQERGVSLFRITCSKVTDEMRTMHKIPPAKDGEEGLEDQVCSQNCSLQGFLDQTQPLLPSCALHLWWHCPCPRLQMLQSLLVGW